MVTLFFEVHNLSGMIFYDILHNFSLGVLVYLIS